MTTGFLQKIFGSRNQRLVKQYQKTVTAINALEPQIEQLTDDQLRAKTTEFRQRVSSGQPPDKRPPQTSTSASPGGDATEYERCARYPSSAVSRMT